MIPPIVRRMAAADLERVLAIAASLREAPHWPLEAYRAALDSQGQPLRIALVVEVSGTVAGFAIASVIAPQAELEGIAVAAEFQRGGAGRCLLDALTQEIKKNCAEEFLLEVRASNRPALELYRSQGFAETGLRPRYYSDPVEDAVLMSLLLR
jgi:ribosomal-protein-alanine N-acetyltransferase